MHTLQVFDHYSYSMIGRGLPIQCNLQCRQSWPSRSCTTLQLTEDAALHSELQILRRSSRLLGQKEELVEPSSWIIHCLDPLQPAQMLATYRVQTFIPVRVIDVANVRSVDIQTSITMPLPHEMTIQKCLRFIHRRTARRHEEIKNR